MRCDSFRTRHDVFLRYLVSGRQAGTLGQAISHINIMETQELMPKSWSQSSHLYIGGFFDVHESGMAIFFWSIFLALQFK